MLDDGTIDDLREEVKQLNEVVSLLLEENAKLKRRIKRLKAGIKEATEIETTSYYACSRCGTRWMPGLRQQLGVSIAWPEEDERCPDCGGKFESYEE